MHCKAKEEVDALLWQKVALKTIFKKKVYMPNKYGEGMVELKSGKIAVNEINGKSHILNL